jgi:site-specific DNA-methyltransferase (adenine-specific)
MQGEILSYEVLHGDCREVMAGMDECSVDSIVTDPPYGLSFMGKGWDKGVPGVEFWVEALRVAKPGSHLLAFGGTRMVHRLAVAIEDAGWEIRDRIHWVYGSGFPKSHNISKAIDKAAGAEREAVGEYEVSRNLSGGSWADLHGKPNGAKMHSITAPATPAAQQWDGWGTALKPAVEPIILARKPFKGTVAANVLEWGTGAINVDGCRVGDEIVTINTWDNGAKPFGDGAGNPYTGRQQQGRFPANLIHDGSDEATEGMGDASRYFYCAKASKKDRDAGLDTEPVVAGGMSGRRDGSMGKVTYSKNHHPTVKPTDLMAYLCRLITPPGGTILDPFNGSGSTGKAAVREGFNYIGCELDPEYVEIARARIAAGVPA